MSKLTVERILELAADTLPYEARRKHVIEPEDVIAFGRAIEAEVRKDYPMGYVASEWPEGWGGPGNSNDD